MRYPVHLTSRVLIVGSSLVCASQMMAQADTGETTDNEEIVYLSPFEVTSEGSIGYQARDTLAGTRLRTDLKDVANAVQVLNSQFLQDTGATDTKSLLVYTTNTEVGSTAGNFSNVGDGTTVNDNSNRISPQTNTRVRGLMSADNTRDFFLTRVPWDGYNVDRVDIQRGANSILFGIGSPAGIINTNLQQAAFYNEGKVEARYGSYSSIRGSVNVNRMLIDGELAVRVAGLYNDEEYRQDPAFSRDKRVYVAARYDPSWARIGSSNLSLKMNYEHGTIKANRPRINPPTDRITPWYNYMGQKVYDTRYINSTKDADQPKDPSGFSWGARSDQTANYEPWLAYWGSDYYGPVVIYGDPHSSAQTKITTGQSTPTTGTGTPDNGSPMTIFGTGINLTDQYAATVHLPGSGIGAWHDDQISDTKIFNFYDNLLDGNTKSEREKWDAFNGTVTETFLDNAAGFEFVYNYESDLQTYSSRIDAGGYAICVDVAQYYPDSYDDPGDWDDTSWVGVSDANPYAGYAYIASRSYGYSDKSARHTLRGTAFVDIDLKKYMNPDSLLVKLLGRHTIQGNWTHMVVNTIHREWEGFGSDNFDTGKDITQGERQIATLSYLSSGSLVGTSLGDNLGISRISASRDPQSGTVALYDNDTAKYTDVGISILDAKNQGQIYDLYRASSCFDEKKVTDSWGVVWNGYLLDNMVVPTVGYRHDEQTDYNSGFASVGSSQNIANFNAPEWYVPTSENDALADGDGGRTYADETGNSTSWGVVVHMPDFLVRKMPLGLNISGFYNKSDNFQPDASRVDLEGTTLSSPSGKTKDYGFVISALDDRISLKVNWYKTSVNNVTLGNGLGGVQYMLGEGEGWALSQMLLSIYANDTNSYKNYNDLGDGTAVDLNGDGAITAADYLPWQPAKENDEASIKTEYAAWMATRKAMFGNDLANPVYQGPMSTAMQKIWFHTTVNDWIAQVKAAGSTADAAALINGGASAFTNTSGPSGMSVTGDEESKGIEFEFTAQITKNWNLAINAAKTEATRFNLAPIYVDYSERCKELYDNTPYGGAHLWGPWQPGAESLGARFNSTYYGSYMLQRALEGSNVPELCKWRFNVVTNYTVSEGAMKGFNIGGGYRWQDKIVIGYPIKDVGDGDYVYDINKPWKGPTLDYVDLWLGYERPINDNVTWRIQLNVRNLFDKDDLIPVTVNPADNDGDGVYESYAPSTYRIPEGRTWYITSSFTF